MFSAYFKTIFNVASWHNFHFPRICTRIIPVALFNLNSLDPDPAMPLALVLWVSIQEFD